MGKKAAVAMTLGGGGAAAAVTTIVVQNSSSANTDENELLGEEESLDSLPSGNVENFTETFQDIYPRTLVSKVIVPTSPLQQFQDKHWKPSNGNSEDFYFGEEGAITNVAPFTTEGSKTLKQSSSFWIHGSYDTIPNKTKSSLRVKVDRKNYSNGKWNGTLTWFWSFAHNNKGFATFNTAEAKEGKLVLTGGFYMLERENENSQWTIKHHKEITEGDEKYLDEHNFNQYFPKPYWYTSYKSFRHLYYTNWDFINGAEELDDICTRYDTCDEGDKSAETITKEFKWEWRGDEWYNDKCHKWPNGSWCDTIYEWGGDSSGYSTLQWYDYMYGKSDFDLAVRSQYFYRGSWHLTEAV